MTIANPSRNLVQSGQIVTDGDASASITSKIVDIARCSVCGVQLVSPSGTRVGTIAVQESINGDDWSPVQFADETTSIAVSSGSALSDLKNLAGLGGQFLRVVFTSTSGTGTLQVWAFPKAGI